MRYTLLMFLFLLIACHSKRKVQEATPVEKEYKVRIESIHLTHTDFKTREASRYRKYAYIDVLKRVVYGKAYDSVVVYESDTLISTFRTRNYQILDEIRVYYTSGQLAYFEQMADSSEIRQPYTEYYFDYFTGVRQGKCEQFYRNGNRRSIEFYKDGKIDSMKQEWYKNGNVFFRFHLDSSMYYTPEGNLKELRCYKIHKKQRVYAQYLYWPNHKLQSESYYFYDDMGEPCLTWVEYDEKGKVLKKTVKDGKDPGGPARIAEFYDPDGIIVKPCDMEQTIVTYMDSVLKANTSARLTGKYQAKFKIEKGYNRLISMQGPVNPSLKRALTELILQLGCDSRHESGFNRVIQGEDYYILDFEIINKE